MNSELVLPDGRPIHLRRWPVADPAGAVLCLHGMESHAGWFDEFGRALAQLGWEAWCYDRPGWGRSPGRRGYLSGPDDALRQLEEVAGRMGGRVHLLGLSWGGLLAAFAGLKRPAAFASLSLVAPGIRVRRSLSPAALWSMGRGAPVRLPLEPEDFATSPERRAWIRDDPHRTRSVDPRFLWATHWMQRTVDRNAGRLPRCGLFLAGRDTVVDNRATRRLFEGTSTRVCYYPRAAHSLVLEVPDRLAADVVRHVEGR